MTTPFRPAPPGPASSTACEWRSARPGPFGWRMAEPCRRAAGRPAPRAPVVGVVRPALGAGPHLRCQFLTRRFYIFLRRCRPRDWQPEPPPSFSHFSINGRPSGAGRAALLPTSVAERPDRHGRARPRPRCYISFPAGNGISSRRCSDRRNRRDNGTWGASVLKVEVEMRNSKALRRRVGGAGWGPAGASVPGWIDPTRPTAHQPMKVRQLGATPAARESRTYCLRDRRLGAPRLSLRPRGP